MELTGKDLFYLRELVRYEIMHYLSEVERMTKYKQMTEDELKVDTGKTLQLSTRNLTKARNLYKKIDKILKKKEGKDNV